MAKTYPAIGSKKPPRNKGGLPCIVCGERTTGIAHIEVNWFRGDDDSVRVCAAHQKDNAGILAAYQGLNHRIAED